MMFSYKYLNVIQPIRFTEKSAKKSETDEMCHIYENSLGT